ncbi:MAG: sulfotransferase [Oscillatoriales cyanobacterium RM2_1_1]|nr:sulfotransferase [Oscillatoriales cyanobacterium SM2_3_0]NJO46157.1 sulfotransferase [Oscillatoriales cyanobacterium RM2_1_1]
MLKVNPQSMSLPDPLQFLIRYPNQSRSLHAYCIGTPKSGTHSLAAMLKNYRSSHEPEWQNLIDLIGQEHLRRLHYETDDYLITNQKYISYFKIRDRRLNLEFEASHLLGPFVQILVKAFPRAKFILTLRDCYSWIDSMINDELNMETQGLRVYWRKAYDYYFFSENHTYSPKESVLKYQGLYPLSAYIQYWKRHNETIIQGIPAEQLLILKTHEINNSTDRIADYLGILESQISTENKHAYPSKGKHHVLKQIPQTYLLEKVQYEAGELMKTYFPDSQGDHLYD